MGLPELAKIERELNFSSVGRKPRLSGTVETIETVFQSHRSAFALLPDTFEKARKACPGYDVYALEANGGIGRAARKRRRMPTRRL
jgi:hypothetical protein